MIDLPSPSTHARTHQNKSHAAAFQVDRPAMSTPHSAGGFSLFPNPNNAPGSRSQSRPRTAAPQEGHAPAAAIEATPPRTGRRRNSTRPSTDSGAGPSATAAATAAAPGPQDPVVDVPYAQPVTDVPQRCETAFSEAQTLVRSSSQRSRNSIAKPPLAYAPAGPGSSSFSPPGEPAAESSTSAVRSIFPRYNPDVSLDRQDYYPTQASPTHIPQAAISRALYAPPNMAPLPGAPSSGLRSPPAAAAISPAVPTANSHGRWPGPGQRHHEPPAIPPVSSTEELRGLWKVTNGWRASSLEGRTYCLQLATAADAPTYTLASSAGQPFYCLRVDPTSASAIVSLSRYDPNKPFKPASTTTTTTTTPPGTTSSPSPRPSSSSSASRRPDPPTTAHTPATTAPKHLKNWTLVLTTTLPAPRPAGADADAHDDGLLADLWPCAAARLAADRANDAATVALAQHESARLVYDGDSGARFLVHPALAVPFCVTVERRRAGNGNGSSTTTYTLEHLESPCHLARLTRDATGGGWLEVDTAVAGKVESVYLVDVAVAALVLVAHGDAGHVVREAFEPPPVAAGFDAPPGACGGGGAGSADRDGKREVTRGRGMEQFEMDLESQSSLKKDEKDKVPAVLRALVKLVTVMFKCFVWCATMVFKALFGILSGVARCCGLGKL
ncbi:hypothetical protein BT67DRAFT_425354 [Trichocladium antarcticum]|uniref:Acetylserotonin methytransferase-like protein n=1 Tax=Trichocladium antarcticum TaxID=1450529 RepID=A0AAN6UGF3_9PEZI|nr:hypothetical protein BT67DRAFT_425354 [Trichocladium antarcticum]